MLPVSFLNLKEPQMKFLKNLTILAMVGVLLILIGSIFTQEAKILLDPSTMENTSDGDAAISGGSFQYEFEKNLKADLIKILSRIEGVGHVSVELTFESGPEYELAYDREVRTSTTEEEDSAGGIRKISELVEDQRVVIVNDRGERPIIVKEVQPKVRGVLVVAEGADNSRVKAMLFSAVQAVLDLPAHKIQVLPGRR